MFLVGEGAILMAMVYTRDGSEAHEMQQNCIRWPAMHNFALDFGISQLLIVRSSNGLQHSDGNSKGFLVVCDPRLSVKYFLLATQRWTSQENIEMIHRE